MFSTPCISSMVSNQVRLPRDAEVFIKESTVKSHHDTVGLGAVDLRDAVVNLLDLRNHPIGVRTARSRKTVQQTLGAILVVQK